MFKIMLFFFAKKESIILIMHATQRIPKSLAIWWMLLVLLVFENQSRPLPGGTQSQVPTAQKFYKNFCHQQDFSRLHESPNVAPRSKFRSTNNQILSSQGDCRPEKVFHWEITFCLMFSVLPIFLSQISTLQIEVFLDIGKQRSYHEDDVFYYLIANVWKDERFCFNNLVGIVLLVFKRF